MHTNQFGNIHNSRQFLAWHRWYLLQIENILRKVDPIVTVPYWDWSLWSGAPWLNQVFICAPVWKHIKTIFSGSVVKAWPNGVERRRKGSPVFTSIVIKFARKRTHAFLPPKAGQHKSCCLPRILKFSARGSITIAFFFEDASTYE